MAALIDGLPSLLRGYHPEGMHVLQLRVDHGGDAEQLLTDWAVVARERFGRTVILSQPVGLSRGVAVLTVDEPDDRETYERVCRDLITTLEAAGVRGRLAPVPARYSPVFNGLVTSQSVAIAISLRLTPEADRQAAARGWYGRDEVDPTAFAAVAEHALNWCRSEACDLYVASAGFSLQLSEPAWMQTARHILTRPAELAAHKISGVCWPSAGRGVVFTPTGEALYYLSRAETLPPAADALAEAQAIFEALAPHATFGYTVPIGHAQLYQQGLLGMYWSAAKGVLPPFELAGEPYTRGLVKYRGLDAFACMLLGPDFAGPSADGLYSTRLVPGGCSIATHRDAETWLGALTPPPSEVEIARSQLAGMLISDEHVSAEALRLGRRPPAA